MCPVLYRHRPHETSKEKRQILTMLKFTDNYAKSRNRALCI